MKQTLDACQNGSNIISGTPSILQDVETEFSIGINIWMEHA